MTKDDKFLKKLNEKEILTLKIVVFMMCLLCYIFGVSMALLLEMITYTCECNTVDVYNYSVYNYSINHSISIIDNNRTIMNMN